MIEGDVVRFKVKNYSPDAPLIIDPTEIFFTYTGSTSDNWGFTATYGPDGSFFQEVLFLALGLKFHQALIKKILMEENLISL